MEKEIIVWMGGFDDGRTPGVQQYDANSRKYLCRLMEKPGVPYLMEDDAVVGVVFKWRGEKPSHMYSTDVLDRSTVRVTVPAAAMKKTGNVEMQLKIHQGGGVLNGPVMIFRVNESLPEADSETDEPALLLVQLVNEAGDAVKAAENAAVKISNLSVDVEMLNPHEEARATVTQTETAMDLLLSIPKSTIAYATFEVNEDMELLIRTPDGFDGISFALNDDGELEVRI